MLKRTLILLVLALIQFSLGCEQGVYPYNPVTLDNSARERLERDKREFIQIEDLKLGDGPLAVWGRRIKADLEVRYADGTVVYRGPILDYVGFLGDVSIHNSGNEAGLLSLSQRGIVLGMNGMAVGGKRRITIHPRLACDSSTPDDELPPNAGCLLIPETRQQRIWVRKQPLIVEAVLTESCLPVSFRALKMGGGYAIDIIVGCRGLAEPGRDPTAPLWHIY
ncbi:exported hypothetical protein [Nitrospira lenta]|uniref:Uncharacterized protein n=2 Tax=Nitrospira lenta TaxID=1436998 RepID=A0A330LA31_9BACT|nr:exported hypothetical protein [Nitrospira lenta]